MAEEITVHGDTAMTEIYVFIGIAVIIAVLASAVGAFYYLRVTVGKVGERMVATPLGGGAGNQLDWDTTALADGTQYVRVTVSDTGGGIAEEVRERLFNLRVTTKEFGSGIGLHVARIGIETWGGSVSLEQSGPGGSTFVVDLPTVEGRTDEYDA